MSLATRVSIFFLAALAVMLIGFSATLYLLARTHFQRDLDERLMTALDGLSAAVGTGHGREAWQPGTRAPLGDDHTGEAPVSWAVFNEKGIVVDGTHDGSCAGFRGALKQTPGVGHVHLSVNGPDDRHWRVVARQIAPGVSDNDQDERLAQENDNAEARAMQLYVVTGTPLEPLEASLRNVALTLTGLSAGLWLLSAAGGHWFCRRALRPVSTMAQAAGTMSANDRGQRLPSPGTSDELENLARSFNGLIDRLHEALDRQQRFTGDASHQLRTPLTALIGEIELALRRERSPQDYQRVLERILGDALRVRQIVESLLFLARADAEADTPSLEAVDLAAWLPEHLDHWSQHARSCDFHYDIAAASPAAVRVHPPLLGQLLDNLLDNACKYSAPGTPIHVRLEHHHQSVVLSVEDHGSGIDAHEIPHVFDPFFRSSRVRLRGQPGFGLGLAVAQRIVAAFGGSIHVESTLGQGSHFIVRFPEAVGALPVPTPEAITV